MPSHRLTLVAAVAAIALAAAPPAHAAVSTVDVESDTALKVRFNDSPILSGAAIAIRSLSPVQPRNDFRITGDADGQSFTVVDDAGPDARVLPGDRCEPIGAALDRVRCTIPGGAAAVFVDAGLGDDRVRNLTSVSSLVLGGLGDDTLTGGPFIDDLRGAEGHDVLTGGSGQDKLEGGIGADELHGDEGNDSLDGGDGPDLLVGEEPDQAGAPDVLDGGDGDDIVRGGAGDDGLSGGAGADQLFGEAGGDTVHYDDHASGVTVAIDAHVGDGGPDDGPVGSMRDFVSQDVENVDGSDFDDQITGSAADNRLRGGAGRDRLDGGGGDDLLLGGAGADVLTGGAGADTASYRDGEHDAGVQVTLDGVADDGGAVDEQAGLARVRDNVQLDVENLIGTAGGDVLNGDAAANRLEGDQGADVMNGGPGDDSVEAGDGTPDQVACGGGIDAAQLDLVDQPAGSELAPEPADCEDIERAAFRQPRAARIAPRARLAHRRLIVRLTCPLNGPRCRGQLTIRRGHSTVAARAYALRAGASRRLRLALRRAPGRRPRAIARERDARGRPKLSVRTLRLVRPAVEATLRGVYVGRVTGTRAFAAIVLGRRRARAYVCDSRQTAVWFAGPRRHGTLDLRAHGLRVQAHLAADAATGTVTFAEGSRHRLRAPTGPAPRERRPLPRRQDRRRSALPRRLGGAPRRPAARQHLRVRPEHRDVLRPAGACREPGRRQRPDRRRRRDGGQEGRDRLLVRLGR